MTNIWSYPGGKTRMAKVLVDGMACALERAGASFHEPFVGGGAVATEESSPTWSINREHRPEA